MFAFAGVTASPSLCWNIPIVVHLKYAEGRGDLFSNRAVFGSVIWANTTFTEPSFVCRSTLAAAGLMDRIALHIWLLCLFCNQLALANDDSCTSKVQEVPDEDSDDVMLLAMPQRPRPVARKTMPRSVSDIDVTSLFQVDEVTSPSTPSVIIKSDGEVSSLSTSWVLVCVTLLFLVLLLGMCALQNGKEAGVDVKRSQQNETSL
eukprot:Skav205186  [mRNA]  locus=scaffold300:44636:50520:+ [translate_table: standard]